MKGKNKWNIESRMILCGQLSRLVNRLSAFYFRGD